MTSVASLSFVLAVDAAKPIKSIDELRQGAQGQAESRLLRHRLEHRPGRRRALQGEARSLDGVVPYKVTVDALAGVVGGGVDFISYDTTWAITQHPQRIRILAVTAARRQSALPDIPTLSELGLGEFDIAPWFGVVVPAGTPRPIVERLAAWFNQITASDDAKQFLARAALDAFPGSPESMAAHLLTETFCATAPARRRGALTWRSPVARSPTSARSRARQARRSTPSAWSWRRASSTRTRTTTRRSAGTARSRPRPGTASPRW